MEHEQSGSNFDKGQLEEDTTWRERDDIISLSSEEEEEEVDEDDIKRNEGIPEPELGKSLENFEPQSVEGTENERRHGDDTLQLSNAKEQDVDSSLYVVSDLEDCDSGSDVSFTDVPSLLMMEDEPSSSGGKFAARLVVSLTSPERTTAAAEACDIPGSPSEPVLLSAPGADSTAENTDPPPAATSFAESLVWNGEGTDANAAKQSVPSNSRLEREIGSPDAIPDQDMLANFNDSLTISESNDDSVLDNSNSTDDGEESAASSHKEVFIDYRRSLVRKDSNATDPLSDNVSASSSADRDSIPGSYDSGLPTRDSTPSSKYLVVSAIDFGTTYSGYAFAFTRDPDSIHMMRRWEGGDPGVSNQKTPTTLLLTPEKRFHSFGFGARDFYHDLEPSEAKKYMYFEKFKMKLYDCEVST